MFKRLKRIEELMREFIDIERRVEKYIIRNQLEVEAYMTNSAKPWICQKPDCSIGWFHVHSIVESSPASGSGGKDA